jgi:hypothetical protein
MDYEREKPASLLCERYDTRCGLKKCNVEHEKKGKERKKSYFSLHRYARLWSRAKVNYLAREGTNECEKACEVTIAM